MAGRDPFNRQWLKWPTITLEQTRFTRMEFEHFGVFAKAMLWSLRNTETIGYFVEKNTGRALSLDEIIDLIAPKRGNHEKHERQVSEAFAAFMDGDSHNPPLLRHSDRNGYYWDPETYEQFLHENNLVAKRAADTLRQRKSRAKRAGDGDGRVVDFPAKGKR